MSNQTWAITLEQYHVGQDTVIFDSIETGLQLTISREMFEQNNQPATITILVPEEALTEPGKSSHDAEPV